MFRGKVIRGGGIGRQLGYPTANLDTPPNTASIKSGVYAAYASCDGRRYPGALVIQHEPWKVEVHLFAYDGGDCYGRVIDVEPIQKVSEIERHESPEALRQKIQSDLELVKRVLKIEADRR